MKFKIKIERRNMAVSYEVLKRQQEDLDKQAKLDGVQAARDEYARHEADKAAVRDQIESEQNLDDIEARLKQIGISYE
jgi:hypothetical protein